MAENNKVNSVSFFNSRLTSIISIALVLFLLGLILLMGLLGNQLSVYVRENISFSIVLKDNQKEADIKRMQKSLDALPFIKSTEYISKEQAAKELEEELGENPETFLGFNPLQASIEVKLHSEYANPDSLQHIEKKIKTYTSVSDLLYRKDMMQMVNDNMKRLAGYIIHFISTTAAIGDLGHLIGRGGLFSVILVLTVLPALLVLFDRIITSNEWDRLQKHLKKRHEKRKALLKAGLGTIANKMSMGNRSKNIPAEVDSDEV